MSAQAGGPDGGPGGPDAETYLRLIAEAELRRRPIISGPGPHTHRVWLAAATLAAAGAVGPDVAWQAVAEFETAAGLRTGNPASVVAGVRRPDWAGQHGTGRHGTGQHGTGQHGTGQHGAPPAGTRQPAGGLALTSQAAGGPTSVRIGATLPLPPEQEGWYGEFCLLSLARAGSQAALAVAARWAGQTRRAAGPRPEHAPYYEIGAVDDHGVRYRLSLWDMGAHGDREWWDCHLGLNPAPAPGTRWLDVGPGAQGRCVRIDLAPPPGTPGIVTEPVEPVSPAARLLDLAGDHILSLDSSGPLTTVPLSARVGEVIRHLVGAGALRADDPAVLRLAALGWRLGLDLGTGAATPNVPLPAAWTSLLVDRGARDGPDAVAPFAADLPEIGGGRFALAGLRSARDGATLHVMASGWEPAGYGWLVQGTARQSNPMYPSLSWQARDSAGRWHLVSGMSWGSASQSKGMIKMYLTPPLHPAASALDVVVTGPDRRVRATVPLGWGAKGPDQ